MTLMVMLIPAAAIASPQIGEKAPSFDAKTASGETVNLEQYRGKNVVLEWTNHQCPFVIKHYDTGNMQGLQKAAKEDHDTVWLTIVSSAEGKQGYTKAEEAKEVMKENNSNETARLLDPSGEIGKLYGASTTPHMFVIDKEGTLVYQGAIDSNSSPRHSTVEGATNYVADALAALSAGVAVEPASTQPYGCSVKYGS